MLMSNQSVARYFVHYYAHCFRFLTCIFFCFLFFLFFIHFVCVLESFFSWVLIWFSCMFLGQIFRLWGRGCSIRGGGWGG